MKRATVVAFVVFPSVVLATEYSVGDDFGWQSGFHYHAWADDKTFYVGDVLVFNYIRDYNHVIEVDAAGYDQCLASPHLGAYDSGNDRMTLSTPGNKYYICEWHCGYSDQKFMVTVLPN